MCLDDSGSMNLEMYSGGETRIKALETAAKTLGNTLFPTSTVTENLFEEAHIYFFAS